jgi:hypothetical protein
MDAGIVAADLMEVSRQLLLPKQQSERVSHDRERESFGMRDESARPAYYHSIRETNVGGEEGSLLTINK